MKVHKVSDKFDIYLSSEPRRKLNKREITIDNTVYYRFMERLYIPDNVYNLPEELVIEINNIRSRHFGEIVDVKYNNIVYEQTIEAISSHLPYPIRVLDFGCGEGSASNNIKAQFPKARLFGFDIRKTAHNSNYFDIKHGCRQCPLPYKENYFTAIFAFFVFHFYVPDTQIFELRRILNQGGILAFNLINSSDFGILDRLDSSGFSIVEEMGLSTTKNRSKGYLFYAHKNDD